MNPTRWPARHPFSLAALIVTCLVCAPPSRAQIVADPTAPGSQRPTVLLSPNGVPLVHITTPSAAGVSRNSTTARQHDSTTARQQRCPAPMTSWL